MTRLIISKEYATLLIDILIGEMIYSSNIPWYTNYGVISKGPHI